MRLAILLPDLRCGGAERMRVTMCAELRRRGVEVELWLMRAEGELLTEVPAGIPVRNLDARRVRGLLPKLRNAIQDSTVDVLLADMWPLTAIAVAAARTVRRPVRIVTADHNTLSLTPQYTSSNPTRFAMRASMRLLYPLASTRIAVSVGVARDLSQISGLPVSSFTVVNNPVAVGSQPAAIEDPWGNAPRPRILNVGTLKEQKDQTTLVRAMGRSRAGSCAILGEGPLRETLSDEARRQHVSLLLPGFVRDVHPWYEGADLFVLSSRYEGFGNVLVEALDHGLPIVSTDCPSGPADILDGGRFGELVPVGDPGAMAAAMDRALAAHVDPEVQKGRAQSYSVPRVTEQYLEVLFGNTAKRTPLS